MQACLYLVTSIFILFFPITLLYSQSESDTIRVSQVMNTTEMDLQLNGRFVKNLNEALEASITVSLLDGHGSGFFISDNLVITNYHVIEGRSLIKSSIHGKTIQFNVFVVDTTLDLAILESDYISEVYYSLSESATAIGQDIFIIGSPTSELLANSVSSGIISGIREFDELEIIQTDAKVNSGNSGGALIDAEGRLYGVVTSKVKGVGIEGIGFAISTKHINQLLNKELTE